MHNKFLKSFLIFSFAIYLVTSYVAASFNPFEAPLIMRLIQVCLLCMALYAWFYEEKED